MGFYNRNDVFIDWDFPRVDGYELLGLEGRRRLVLERCRRLRFEWCELEKE